MAFMDRDMTEASLMLDRELEDTNKRIARLTQKINEMSDDEFFSELQKLRLEHQKTLEICERLYNKNGHSEDQQHTFHNSKKHCDLSWQPDVPSATIVKGVAGLAHQEDFTDGYLKMPPKHRRMVDTNSVTIPTGNDRQQWMDKVDQWDQHTPEEASALDIRRKVREAWRRHAYDCGDDTLLQTNHSQSDFTRRPESSVGGRQSNLSKEAQRSKSTDEHHLLKQQQKQQYAEELENWRHKITIPKPFQMTLREEQLAAEAKKRPKTTSMVAMERELEERNQREEEELKKNRHFRARPVPAHVYLPLYETLQDRQRARREFLHNFNMDLLKSQERPFGFHLREKEKQRLKEEEIQQYQQRQQHQRNASNQNTALQSYKEQRQATVVKPRPIPKTHYEDRSEKMKEEELLRQIMAKMRAEELLRISAEPEGMRERRQKQEEEKRKKQEESVATGQNFNTVATRGRTKKVPNFEKLHQKLQQKGAENRTAAEMVYTKPKPFSLRTASRSLERKPRQNSLEVFAGQRRSSGDGFQRRDHTKALMSAMEVPDPSYTKNHVLREAHMKEKRRSEADRSTEIEKEEMHRKRRDRELGKEMRTNFDIVNPRQSIEMETKVRKQRLRHEDFERAKQYQDHLREMSDRVKSRPLLIHQQQALMAKMQAEKKYQKALSSAGLTDEFVESRGRQSNAAGETLVAWPSKVPSSQHSIRSTDNPIRDRESRMEFANPDDDSPPPSRGKSPMQEEDYNDESFNEDSN